METRTAEYTVHWGKELNIKVTFNEYLGAAQDITEIWVNGKQFDMEIIDDSFEIVIEEGLREELGRQMREEIENNEHANWEYKSSTGQLI